MARSVASFFANFDARLLIGRDHSASYASLIKDLDALEAELSTMPPFTGELNDFEIKLMEKYAKSFSSNDEDTINDDSTEDRSNPAHL